MHAAALIAPFAGGINIGGGSCSPHHAEPREHLLGDTADPELQTFEVNLRPILAEDLAGARKAYRPAWETSLPDVERTGGAGWALAGAAATQAATGALQDHFLQCISRVLHARCRTPGQSRIPTRACFCCRPWAPRISGVGDRRAPRSNRRRAGGDKAQPLSAVAPLCRSPRAVPPIPIAESHDLELF
jgi:hypothetical protein